MIIRHRRARRVAELGARLGFAVSLIAFSLSFVAMVAGSPPAAAAATEGTATIISPSTDAQGAEIPDGGAPLEEGDSETDFSFRLPEGAACSGDSANDGYRVFGYVIGGSIDPASMSFVGNTGPLPEKFGAPLSEFRMPLHDVDGTPYQAAQTAAADPPPGPGNVINIPTFDLKVFGSADNLPAGKYNVGIACVDIDATPSPVLDKFWNTELTIVSDPGDTGPVKIGWTAEPPATLTSVELEADPAPEAAPGDVVTLTATVTPTAAEGTVTFKKGTKTLEDPVEVEDGVAELEVDDLAVGEHTFVAVFKPKRGTPYEQATSDELELTVSETAGTATGDTTTTMSAGSSDSTTSTTALSAAAVGSSTGGPTTGSAPLAFTGSSMSLAVWGALLLVFGRMAILLGRKPAVRPALAL